MESSTISNKAHSKASKLLRISVISWFVVVVIGQFIFALYIMGLYGVSGLAGDFERWNTASPHGYVVNDVWGNIFFGIHMAMAAIITIGGPLQLMKKIRARFPRFHRFNGRVYISGAFLISLAGLCLAWVRGMVGGLTGALFISANAVFILGCAFFTIKYALARKLDVHRRWAIRLFLAMSGVWFFRVFLMLWLALWQGPVGLDIDSFEGPALNMLYTFSYICPVLFAGLYFNAKKTKLPIRKTAVSVFLFFLTMCIAVGSAVATMGMWIPGLKA